MSLDVYLSLPGVKVQRGSGIFVRRDGKTLEITREEWDAIHPGVEPVRVVSQDDDPEYVYESNITHNVAAMAKLAGVYDCCWRPNESGLTKAKDLIEPLTVGLRALEADPGRFKRLNPENGWGNYDGLVEFVREYLEACVRYPEADVRVWA